MQTIMRKQTKHISEDSKYVGKMPKANFLAYKEGLAQLQDLIQALSQEPGLSDKYQDTLERAHEWAFLAYCDLDDDCVEVSQAFSAELASLASSLINEIDG